MVGREERKEEWEVLGGVRGEVGGTGRGRTRREEEWEW